MVQLKFLDGTEDEEDAEPEASSSGRLVVDEDAFSHEECTEATETSSGLSSVSRVEETLSGDADEPEVVRGFRGFAMNDLNFTVFMNDMGYNNGKISLPPPVISHVTENNLENKHAGPPYTSTPAHEVPDDEWSISSIEEEYEITVSYTVVSQINNSPEISEQDGAEQSYETVESTRTVSGKSTLTDGLDLPSTTKIRHSSYRETPSTINPSKENPTFIVLQSGDTMDENQEISTSSQEVNSNSQISENPNLLNSRSTNDCQLAVPDSSSMSHTHERSRKTSRNDASYPSHLKNTPSKSVPHMKVPSEKNDQMLRITSTTSGNVEVEINHECENNLKNPDSHNIANGDDMNHCSIDEDIKLKKTPIVCLVDCMPKASTSKTGQLTRDQNLEVEKSASNESAVDMISNVGQSSDDEIKKYSISCETNQHQNISNFTEKITSLEVGGSSLFVNLIIPKKCNILANKSNPEKEKHSIEPPSKIINEESLAETLSNQKICDDKDSSDVDEISTPEIDPNIESVTEQEVVDFMPLFKTPTKTETERNDREVPVNKKKKRCNNLNVLLRKSTSTPEKENMSTESSSQINRKTLLKNSSSHQKNVDEPITKLPDLDLPPRNEIDSRNANNKRTIESVTEQDELVGDDLLLLTQLFQTPARAVAGENEPETPVRKKQKCSNQNSILKKKLETTFEKKLLKKRTVNKKLSSTKNVKANLKNAEEDIVKPDILLRGRSGLEKFKIKYIGPYYLKKPDGTTKPAAADILTQHWKRS